MPDPITFATEADRLKAREQFVATMQAVYPNARSERYDGRKFDAAFPPITPPKMVPFTAWVSVDEESGKYGHGLYLGAPALPNGHRLARVRVEEIEDTP